ICDIDVPMAMSSGSALMSDANPARADSTWRPHSSQPRPCSSQRSTNEVTAPRTRVESGPCEQLARYTVDSSIGIDARNEESCGGSSDTTGHCRHGPSARALRGERLQDLVDAPGAGLGFLRRLDRGRVLLPRRVRERVPGTSPRGVPRESRL